MASAATVVTSCSLLLQFRNPKLISHKHSTKSSCPNRSSQRLSFYPRTVDAVQEFTVRDNHLPFFTACAISPGVAVAPTGGENLVTSSIGEDGKIKVRIYISGAKSEEIFENVFSKMVAAAQPIPGFRRVKGGKTPNIPRDILIEILGPTKVYKQVIKKIINSTLAEYVKKGGNIPCLIGEFISTAIRKTWLWGRKENLKVTKNVKVEQSFEELEATFEPGMEFSFDAVLELRETGTRS